MRIALSIFLLVFSGCSTIQDSIVGFGKDVINFLPGDVESDQFKVEDKKYLSQEEEYWLGRAVAARIFSVYKPLNSSKIDSYVAKVGLSVAKFSDRPDTFKGYSFQILDSKDINAISAPGGFVFITSGLLKLMNSEDELAAVLAHEISHISKQHGLASINNANRSKGTEVGGKVLGAVGCTEAIQLLNLAFEAAVDDIVNSLLVNGYSRDQEYEADALALEILNRSGYIPIALGAALTEIKHSNHSDGGWFSTHPTPDERLAKLNMHEYKGPPVEDPRRKSRFVN